MEYLSGITPDIEQLSIDECYMDYAPISSRYTSAETAAAVIKDTIYEKLDATLDRIRSKYGKDAVKRGCLMEQALPQASSHEEGSRNT